MFGRSVEPLRCPTKERNRSLCHTLPKRAQTCVTSRDRNNRPKNTYSHLWPDSDDRTREAVDRVLANPAADSLRTGVIG